MRRAVAAVTVMALALLAACSGSDSDDPEAKPPKSGGPTVTVRSAITGRLRWRAPAPKGCAQVTAAGPDYLVVNNTVFDRRTGRVRWTAPGVVAGWIETGSAGPRGPAPDGPTIIFESADGKWVVARDPGDGAVRWRRRGAFGSAIFVGPDTVAFAARADDPSKSSVTAVNRRTGRVRWRADLPLVGFASAGAGSAFLVGESGTSALRAFDSMTGTFLWSAEFLTGGPQSLGTSGDVVVLRANRGIDAYDVATGAHLWTGPSVDLFEVHPGGGTVVAWQSGATTAQILDARTGVVIATPAVRGGGMLTVGNGRSLFVSSTGYAGVDRNGARDWRVPAPSGVSRGSIQVAGDDLVLTTDGTCNTD